MTKQVIEQKKVLPDFLPNGWKKEVAKRIGVHQASMCRILKNRNQGSLFPGAGKNKNIKNGQWK
jgi:hypothetical protein